MSLARPLLSRVFALALSAVLAGPCLLPAAAQAEDIASVAGDDPVMNAAIAAAQASLPGFLTRAATDPDGEWIVKWARPVEAEITHEHIWVQLIGQQGDMLQGVLANQPVYFDGAAGDEVSFPKAEVSDWLTYTPEGLMEGAYTVRALMDRMSEDERKSLEAQLAPLPQ